MVTDLVSLADYAYREGRTYNSCLRDAIERRLPSHKIGGRWFIDLGEVGDHESELTPAA